MSNLVISGYYGSKNAGDEAMLAAMIEVLQRLDPQLHITVISADPEDTRKRHPVDSIGWLDGTSILIAIGHADLLISGGGSLLQNVTSRRSLYYYLAIIFLAHILRTPAMLYAQGIGPIEGKFAGWLMRKVVDRVKLITVRDKGSLAELSRLGIRRPHIEATADPVLAIRPAGEEAGRKILLDSGVPLDVPLIGISVRDWNGETRFKEVIARVADTLTKTYGVHIVFLPMQYKEDIEAAASVAGLMHEPCTVLEGVYSTADLLSLVGAMKLMIAIRLHALIFAGVMNVPMVGISYDPKIRRFLSSIGEQPVGSLEDLTEEKLLADVRQKWERRDAFRRHNAKLMKRLRELAERNAHLALGLIRKKRHALMDSSQAPQDGQKQTEMKKE